MPGFGQTGPGWQPGLHLPPPATVTAVPGRYWVGGTGTWNTAGSVTNPHWSETSGGPPGASLPTVQQDVFFDNNSGNAASTVTWTTTSTARSVNTTGYTGTLNFATTALVVGNTTTANASNYVFILGATTQTTAAGGGITIACTQTSSPEIRLNSNTFNARFTCTAASRFTFADSGTVAGTTGIAGSFTQTGGTVTIASGANLVFTSVYGWIWNTGTKSMTINGSLTTTVLDASPASGGNCTVSGTGTLTITSSATFTVASANINVDTIISNAAAFTLTCSGTNVFKSLTWNPQADANANLNVTGGALTVTNAFTVNGRIAGQNIISGTGLSAGSAAFSYVTFGGGAYTGAATWSGTGVGVWSGVTGVTASAPKTIYWIGGAAAMMDGTTNHFSASSGGSSGERFPLFGDTLVFDANSGAGAVTTTTSYYISSLTFASPSVTYAPASLSLHQGLVQSTGSQFTITTAAGDNFFGTAAGGNVPTIKNIKIVGNLYGYWTLTGPVTCGRVLVNGYLSLGSSTLTIDGGGTGNGCVSSSSGTSTIDVGTGTLIIDSTKPTFFVGGLTVLNCKYDLGEIRFNKSQTGANTGTSSYGIYWFNNGVGSSVVLVGGVAGTTRVMGGASSGAGNTISVNIDGIAGAGVLDKNAKFICTTVADGFHAASFTSLNSTNTSAALHCALTGNVAFTGAVAIDYCDVATSVASGTIPAHTLNGSLTTTTNWLNDRTTAFTDKEGLTDNRNPEYGRPLTDPEGLSDNVSRETSRIEIVTDNESLTDSTAKVFQYVKSLTDSEGLTDNVAGSLMTTILDLLGLTDTESSENDATITDNEGLTDSANGTVDRTEILTDLLGIIDTEAASLIKSLTDYENLTDSVTFIKPIDRTVDDLEGLTDSLEILNTVTLVDIEAITDDKSLSLTVTITNFEGLVDSLTSDEIVTVTDLLGLLDNQTRSVSTILVDNEGLVDNFGVAVAHTIVDTEALSDDVWLTLMPVITDLLGITDNEAINLFGQTLIFCDSVTLDAWGATTGFTSWDANVDTTSWIATVTMSLCN